MATSPDEKATDEQKSLFDRLGAALPIGLTMLATALAGMSNGELQRAMFWRSYAAQDQAKATSQWSLAGFKRDRALICETAAAQLHAFSGYARPSFDPSPDGPAEQRLAIDWLNGDGPPRLSPPELHDETLKRLLLEIREREPEAQILATAGKLSQEAINSALDEAEKWFEATDREWDPISKAAEAIIAEQLKTGDVKRGPAAQAVGFEMQNRRYRAEAFLNQSLGFLYEARVRVSTAVSDKHRKKSLNLFYAMLAAQIGATIASLALARHQRSLLWFFAGVAGVVSLGIAAYIYLDLA